MTSIHATFTGKNADLDMILVTGLHYYSKKNLDGNTLSVTWICEEADYQTALESCMDCIDLTSIELYNVTMTSFG